MGKSSTVIKEQSRFSAHNLFHHDMTLSLDERMKYGKQVMKILEEIKDAKKFNLLENDLNYNLLESTNQTNEEEEAKYKKKVALKSKLK